MGGGRRRVRVGPPMRRAGAVVGSALFFAAAPMTVAGVVPAVLTGWQMEGPMRHLWPVRLGGAAAIAAAAVVLIGAFGRFVIEGGGTPAPVAPTESLVVGGLYRWVRNPMYLAVVVAISGQALLLGQLVLVAYAGLVWVVVAGFVHRYEEPTLSRCYGSAYDKYRASVPAWIPRVPRPSSRPAVALKPDRRSPPTGGGAG